MYHHYSAECKALIWAVDSADTERMEESRDEMMLVISTIRQNSHVDPLPLLIFANKQDLPMAMRAEEVIQRLRLEELNDSNTNSDRVIWHVQPSCATEGDGLEEGLEFLRKYFVGE